MESNRKKIKGNDADKAIAKVGSSKPQKLKTDEPLSEKDEVKQAEENLRRSSEQKTSQHNRAHMLFR